MVTVEKVCCLANEVKMAIVRVLPDSQQTELCLSIIKVSLNVSLRFAITQCSYKSTFT